MAFSYATWSGQGKISAELSLLVAVMRLSHMLCDASEEVGKAALGGMVVYCSSPGRNREAERTAKGE